MLPLGLRRMLFRSFVLRNYHRLKSFNQAYREAKDLGIRYARKEMIKDFHEVLGIPYKSDRLKHVPKKYYPPKDLIQPSSFAMKSRYHYRYKLEFYDKLTGRTFTEYRSIATNSLLTLRQAEQLLYQRVIDPINDRYPYKVIRYQLDIVLERRKR